MSTKLDAYRELFDGMPDDQIAEVSGATLEEVVAYRLAMESAQPEPKPKPAAKPRAQKPEPEPEAKPVSPPIADTPVKVPRSVRMCANVMLKVRGLQVPYDLKFRDIVTEKTHPGAIAALLRHPTVKDRKGNDIQTYEVYPPEE